MSPSQKKLATLGIWKNAVELKNEERRLIRVEHNKLTYSAMYSTKGPSLKAKECLKYFSDFGKNLKTEIDNFK